MHHWTTVKDVAWVGDELVIGPIRGILLQFHGLGFSGMYEANDGDRLLAEQGVLNVFPYYGPWSWMNREARAMIDDLVDEIYRVYGLAEDVPLVLVGGSMGGGSALLYARYARKPVAGVYANCPACDYVYHFTERPDVARTMYHAFGHYTGDWNAILEENSPLHQVAHLPDVPYFIVHGEEDQAVSKAHHSDRMVRAMRERGMTVTYHEVPGMGHCSPMPDDILQSSREFQLSFSR